MLALGQLAGRMDGVRSRQYYGACPPFSFLYLYVYVCSLPASVGFLGPLATAPYTEGGQKIDLKKQNVKGHTYLANQGLG